jgi:arylsulfatase A-like enzyme
MPRPNILWIVTTQWRAQACGYAGDANARTRFLDRLAAESVNYRQAVTPHPFGPFARAALLTGVAAPENGVRDYFDPLPKNARTIAHALRERGYTTAFFGKWHLGERDRAAALVGEAHARTLVSPEARGGFETWEGFEGGFLLNDPWLHGSRLSEPEQFRGYQSDVVCERAARWITEQAEAARRAAPKPWFAVVSLEPPHPPYDAPAAGVAVRDPRAIALPGNVPRGGEVEARARRELAGYYAHIEATDRAIGTWLLPRAGAGAMVVFTSAHGDMHGAQGHFRKGWPHEESVRVPLLVRGASAVGTAARGETRDAPVSLLDLPELTLAAADGREPRPPAEVARISMPSVVALPQQCDRVWRGVRNRARKLVLGPDDAPWLYFDLEADPLEQRNLAAEPSRRGEIAAWRKLV